MSDKFIILGILQFVALLGLSYCRGRLKKLPPGAEGEAARYKVDFVIALVRIVITVIMMASFLWTNSPLSFSLLTLVAGILATVAYAGSDSTGQFRLEEQHQWIPQFGVSYALGVDGLFSDFPDTAVKAR